MNDKSKNKSIIMALAVFIAIAAFASPLLMSDDNGDSNTVVLSDEAPDYVSVSSQDDIDNAAENSKLLLNDDFTGSLTIPSGTSLYGIDIPKDLTDLVGAPDGAKTITGDVTLEAGATLNFIKINGKVSICDNNVTVNDSTATEIRYCTINSETAIAISYLDIQAGDISIVSNEINNSNTTNAILSFEGARDGKRGATASESIFSLSISNNKLGADEGRAFSGNDKVGLSYAGGSQISISNNIIADAPSWGASIMLRSLNENSTFDVSKNNIANGDKPEVGLSGGNAFDGDANSFLDGFTTDAKSLIIPIGSIAVLSEGSEFEFERITVNGTITYDGSSISNVDGISAIKAGSLIINGELTPIGADTPIVVSGDITLEGSLMGKLIILPEEIDEDGNVLVKSNIKLRNFETTDGAVIEYKLTVDDEGSVSDIGTISNVSEIKTNEAGEDVVISNLYEDRGVIIDVHDIEYNSEYQDAPVDVTQFKAANNIKVLKEITYTNVCGAKFVYNVEDYFTDSILDVNGISAKVETIDKTSAFLNLKVTNAGKYELTYIVSTNAISDDGKNIVDSDFKVEFTVSQKVIKYALPLVVKIFDGTTDVFGNIVCLDIFDEDEVSFLLEFESADAGIHKLIFKGLDGEDADNYILADYYFITNYTHDCCENSESCECGDLPFSMDDCTCENDFCMCKFIFYGLILPKTITSDMITISNVVPSFDHPDKVYPTITVELLDGTTVELDTSKMNERDYDIPFDGFFVNKNDCEQYFEFEDGISINDAGDYYAVICNHPLAPSYNMNYSSSFSGSNYIAGPILENIFYEYIENVIYELPDATDNGMDNSIPMYLTDLLTQFISHFTNNGESVNIQDIINLLFTLPINGEDSGNKAIVDIDDRTLFMMYYLASAEENANLKGELAYDGGNNIIRFSEDLKNEAGLRAWYLSFNNQLSEFGEGDYHLRISADDVTIAEYTFTFSSDGIDDIVNVIYDEGYALDFANAWASKKGFESKSGIVINYHYIYDDKGSEIREEHIEQIINIAMLKNGLQYTYSNVGAQLQQYEFLRWSTVGSPSLYDDACLVDNELFHFNALEVIDRTDLESYAVDGVLNLYAVYDMKTPKPDNKSIDNVAAFYDIDAKKVQDLMSLYGINVDDVISRTMAFIYEQSGYSNTTMKGILYKLVNGELLEVYHEDNLNSDDGLRAWYFSFDDQVNSAVDTYGLAGYYDARIVAVDPEGNETELLSAKFHIAEELYGANITVDYVNVDDINDAVKVYIEPKNGCLVPAGDLIVAYSFMSSGPFGDEPASALADAVPIPVSSSTQIIDVDISGMDSANAIFKWIDSSGHTVYSLSNTVTSQ